MGFSEDRRTLFVGLRKPRVLRWAYGTRPEKQRWGQVSFPPYYGGGCTTDFRHKRTRQRSGATWLSDGEFVVAV